MRHSLLSLAVIFPLAFASSNLYAHGDEEKNQSAKSSTQSLTAVLKSMPDATKARCDARHPKQTIEFFGIKPGMTVVEGLPGGGWYSKILLPYLGQNGKLIGADYAMDMYPKFGFFSKERLEEKKTWVSSWTKEANTWRTKNSATVSAFQLGSMPKEMNSSADAVVFVRAMHNLARFESDGGYLTKALQDAYKALKPGGIVGIVQHQAPESSSDEWANGSRGYIKKSFLLSTMKNVGFEFVASSDINQNPKDVPSEQDIVWRLPPSLATSAKDPDLKKKYLAIGESNRMTLLFRKPK
jgi:predicted methyltransferase